MLLIITNTADLTADFLIEALLHAGMPYFRMNADELATARFTAEFPAGPLNLSVAGRSIDFRSVRTVWFRRAPLPGPAAGVTAEFQHFAHGELRHLIEGLLLVAQAQWVNPLYATIAGERKLYQLEVAASCGLTVPRTVVSTDPERLASFATSRDGDVICKPIYHGYVAAASGNYAVYTHPVAPADLAHVQFPTLIQERVRKGRDIRITLVGEAVFAVEIETDQEHVDWRAPGVVKRYEETQLPQRVLDGLRALMARLDLVYGAVDMIRDESGRWVFLEVNPAGEWGWLELEVGLPIRDAFLTLFRNFESRMG